MPWCTNGDVDLRYSERGPSDGPPVVLLPGLLFSRRMHERLARRLPNHRVLMLDVRGHGESTSPTTLEAYGWDRWASDVAALLDHLGLDRAIIGGTSLGANITMAFAAAHVDRMAGAIIEAPVLEIGQVRATTLFSLQAEVMARTACLMRPVSKMWAEVSTPSPELASIRDLLSHDPDAAVAVLKSLFVGVETIFLGVDAMVQRSTPTLVIGNHHVIGRLTDEVHAIEDARRLAQRVPGAELVEVPCLVDMRLRPNRYADVVGGFLARTSAAVK